MPLGLGIGVANACDRLPGKADRAATSVGTGHPEGMDGVIVRAGIALRGADQADLEYSQLGEAVPVGITECSLIDIFGFVRVRVATRHLELQKVPKLLPPASSFIRLALRDLAEFEEVVDISDEEFARRRGDQVASPPVPHLE